MQFLSPLFSRFINCFLNHRVSTIYDIFRPVFYCCVPFGMTAFNVRKDRFKNCKWIVVWNSVVAFMYTVLTLAELTSKITEGNVGAMYNIVNFATGWICVINSDFIIIFGCVFRKKVTFVHMFLILGLITYFQVFKLLEDLDMFDQEVKISNIVQHVTQTYKFRRAQLVALITLTLLLLTLIIIFEEGTYYSNHAIDVNVVSHCSAYAMPLICTSFMVLQFCTFIATIKQRYSWLNKQIKEISKMCNRELSHKQNTNERYSM